MKLGAAFCKSAVIKTQLNTDFFFFSHLFIIKKKIFQFPAKFTASPFWVLVLLSAAQRKDTA